MKRVQRKAGVAVALSLVAALLLTACGGSKPAAQPAAQPQQQAQPQPMAVGPGVTDTTITLGADTDMTGPTNYYGAGAVDGMNAYFKYINDTKGGVKGRKLVLSVEDYAYDTNKGIAAYNRLKDKVLAFGLIFGGPLVDALSQPLKDDKVPTNVWAFAASNFVPAHPYKFGTSVVIEDQVWVLVRYVTENLKQKGKRFAVIRYESPSTQAVIDGLKGAGPKYGQEVVGEITFPISTTDFSSSVRQLAALKPDYIFIGGTFQHDQGILREMDKIGLKPVVLKAGGGLDPSYFKVIPPDYDFYLTSAFALADEPAAGIKQLKEIVTQQLGADKAAAKAQDSAFLTGWVMGAMMVDALNKAKDLTRESLRTALEQVQVDTAGLSGPVQTTPNRHVALSAVKVAKVNVNAKKFDVLTDFLKSENPLLGQ